MMDALEGYADGLAGAGMQDRPIMPLGRESYESGFFAGSLDRKTMLAPDAFHRWADGLMNSTAGDVMQPIERGAPFVDIFWGEMQPFNDPLLEAELNALREKSAECANVWAEGMGDGNG